METQKLMIRSLDRLSPGRATLAKGAHLDGQQTTRIYGPKRPSSAGLESRLGGRAVNDSPATNGMPNQRIRQQPNMQGNPAGKPLTFAASIKTKNRVYQRLTDG